MDEDRWPMAEFVTSQVCDEDEADFPYELWQQDGDTAFCVDVLASLDPLGMAEVVEFYLDRIDPDRHYAGYRVFHEGCLYLARRYEEGV